MNSTWYNITVVLLWLATMGWLISKKVLPALFVGEPPSYRTVVEAQRRNPVVGWSMDWNDLPIGWALNSTMALPRGLTEVRSKVHFHDLPLREMIPDRLQSFLFPKEDSNVPLQFHLEATSKLTFDPLQRLTHFESAVAFPPLEDVVKVRGTVEGTQLNITVHTGDLNIETERTLPGKALLNDALSPQSHLPGLREGQTWNVEIYSPLRPPNNPVEILQATVEGRVQTLYDGRTIDVWLVVYRNDPGAGSNRAHAPRGKLWVRDDGTVVKQQVMIFGSTMTFVRLPPSEAYELADRGGDWE
jgi:hypothetical protein